MANWDWLTRNTETCGRWNSRPHGESPGHGKWLWSLEGKTGVGGWGAVQELPPAPSGSSVVVGKAAVPYRRVFAASVMWASKVAALPLSGSFWG